MEVATKEGTLLGTVAILYQVINIRQLVTTDFRMLLQTQ
jgi:hypothetical protein